MMVGISHTHTHPICLVVGSCTSHPGVLGSIPKREEPGKTGAPCIKVPGSSRVPPLRSLVRDEQTSSHRPQLVVSRSTCPPISPPSPRKQLCTRSCSNKHTHINTHSHTFVIGTAINTHKQSHTDTRFPDERILPPPPTRTAL
jgi:hypothetical protein